jgi:Flagellar transcriptional activator (FlhC)
MRHVDDRYHGESRQHDLAVWMLRRGARTHTIMKWTLLPRYRIQALSRRYGPGEGDERRRGISPSQLAFFASSLVLESESAMLASLFIAMGAIPEHIVTDARTTLPNVARGEKLMWAYELYLTQVGETHLSLERAVLLGLEVAEGRNLYLRPCTTCPLFTLLELIGPQHVQCAECRDRQGRLAPPAQREPGALAQEDI